MKKFLFCAVALLGMIMASYASNGSVLSQKEITTELKEITPVENSDYGVIYLYFVVNSNCNTCLDDCCAVTYEDPDGIVRQFRACCSTTTVTPIKKIKKAD